MTQSAAITASGLDLLGSTAVYTLTNSSNDIGTLGASDVTGTIGLNKGSNNLAIGTVNGTSGVTAGTVNLTDTGTTTQSQPIAATNLSLSGAGGAYTLTNASNAVSTLAANTGTLSLTDSAALTVGIVNSITGLTNSGALTLTTSGSTSDITVGHAISETGANAVDLSSYRDIDVAATINTQDGALTLQSANSGNNIGAVAIAANITTNGGAITIGGGSGTIAAGSGYAYGDAQYAQGIDINGATVSSGSGNIIMNGNGHSSSSTANLDGIWIQSSSIVQTTSGTITLYGQGGNGNVNGINDSNDGIYIYGTGKITSAQGAISLTGTGGNGTARYNQGVGLTNGGSIASTSSASSPATITINDIEGSGSLDDVGLDMQDSATITAVKGAINITATAGNDSTSNIYDNAITLYGNSNITSTGNVSITLNAIAGSGQNTSHLYFAGNINSIGGSSDTGNITIYTNLLGYSARTNSIQTSGTLTIAPYTNVSMGVGSSAGNTLNLADTVLSGLTAGSYVFGATMVGNGTTSTGNMTINSTDSFSGDNVSFVSGGNISVASALAPSGIPSFLNGLSG